MLSINQVGDYVWKNVNLQPNTTYNLYLCPRGFSYTVGSMSFLSEDYDFLFTFFTMDEVPKTKKQLIESLSFFTQSK